MFQTDEKIPEEILQHRLDAALLACSTKWHWCFKRQVIDVAVIRAALSGEVDGG